MTRYRIQILTPKGEWLDYSPDTHTFDTMTQAKIDIEMLLSVWPKLTFRVVPINPEAR